MSITIRISVIAALLIAVSNAVPQPNVETNQQLLDDDTLSIVCSKLDKATLMSAIKASRSMVMPGEMQRAVITDASSSGEQICIALAELWSRYDVKRVPLDKQLTLRVLIERYKSAQIVSKEERKFLMQLLPDHGNEMVAIVLLRRLFRSFVELSHPMLAARNFNDLDDKTACQKAIKHQISLLSKFQNEWQIHVDNEFFDAFKSYLELSSGGVLLDSINDIPWTTDAIPEPIVRELMRDRPLRFYFCNPGYGSLKYAKLVLQLGADPFGDGSEVPPLHVACWRGSIDVVKELFRFTGSQQLLTRVMSSHNDNVLHCLDRCGYLEVAAEIGRLILESSPDAKDMITAINSNGHNPLHIVTSSGNSNLLSLYLHNLGNLHRNLFVDLMRTASFCCHIDVVRLLLQSGGKWMCDPNLRRYMLQQVESSMNPLEMKQEVITLIEESSHFRRRNCFRLNCAA